MTHTEVEGFVAGAVFRVVTHGVTGAAVIADIAIGRIQIGALGQAIGVANTPLISIIGGIRSTAIGTDVRGDEFVRAIGYGGTNQVIPALALVGPIVVGIRGKHLGDFKVVVGSEQGALQASCVVPIVFFVVGQPNIQRLAVVAHRCGI
ncbi:MAG: hypothetical protein RL678_26 [Pseudomonadota bacterium]